MKVYLMLFILFHVTQRGNSQATVSNIEDLKISMIENAMKVHMETFDTPALSVVLVKDGQSTFINLGTYDRKSVRKVDEHSIYQIASLSKTFTAIIINNLIKENILDPSASINKYLPKYDQKTLKKFELVTIRHLLHHQSGIQRDSRILLKMRKGNGDFQYNYSSDDFDMELQKYKLKHAPGSKYMYSNFGYALLGYIAELSTGSSYESLLNKYVTNNLKTTVTSSIIQDANRMVTAYRKDRKQTIILPMVMGKLTPPSGLFTSTADLSKLLIKQIDDYNNDRDSPLILSEDNIVHHEESKTAYGYGFRIFGDSGALGHGGEMDGYSSFYSIKPKDKWGVAILSSSNGDELVGLWQNVYSIMNK